MNTRFSRCFLASIIFLTAPCAVAETLTIPQTSQRRCLKERQFNACYELGDIYRNTSKPGDIALGNQYIQLGCKLESKRRCTPEEADAHAATYLKAKKDWDEAKRKAINDIQTVKTEKEIGCEKGVAADCDAAGNYYFFLAPTLNPDKGKAMFEEGCRLGDQPSCQSEQLIRKGTIRVYDVEM